MASVVVCAESRSWQQAGLFAERVFVDAELKSFEDRHLGRSGVPILVYLTHPDYDHVRGLLKTLKPGSPNVVIYYASRLAPEEAAQLGKLVGELRPKHTSVVFEAKAAEASVLGHSRRSDPEVHKTRRMDRTRQLRERFGLTQAEMAQALGVSLRTVQNWERNGEVTKPRHLRDLEELWDILKESVKKPEVAAWLRSPNDAFDGKPPVDLVIDGRARDIIVEFRRLQAGEPV